MGIVKAAGILIIRKNGELLICHPTNHAKDFWSIPKGKVDKDETMLDAALRETYEETNIDLVNMKGFVTHYLGSKTYLHKKKRIYCFAFIESQDSVINWSDIDIKCMSNVPIERGGFPEMDDYIWTTLNDAKSLLHETQVFFLDSIKECYGN
jgi:8-oxo-dGTP pyrophosphatase MutT (NUDIX family)